MRKFLDKKCPIMNRSAANHRRINMVIIKNTSGALDLAMTQFEIEELKKSRENLRRRLAEKEAELAQADQLLRNLEEKYFLSFAHVQDVVYMIDAELRITSVSPSVEKILGYRPQDLMGSPVTELRHIFAPESFAQATDDAVALLQKKFVPIRVYKFIARDGTARYGEVSGSYVLRRGRVDGIIAVARDITQRLAEEKRTRNMLTFMKTLIDTIPSPIFCKDIHGVYRDCNREFEAYVGRKREEIVGKNAHELFPAALADRYAAKDRELLAHPGRQVYEHPIRYADGSIREVIVNKATHFNADGELAGVVGVMVDISERKRVEEALRASEQRLFEILNFLPEATLVIDKAGTVVAWNKAMESLTGIPAGDMLGKGDYAYALPFYGAKRPLLADLALKSQPEIEAGYHEVRRVGEILLGDAYIPNLQSGRGYLSAIATVLKDAGGEVVGAIECIRDNTEYKKNELERRLADQQHSLERLRKSLGGTVQVISSLVATRDPFTAGHQLRTAELARAIAVELELPGERIEGLRTAAAIHDLGKIAIPADILTMPRRLTPIEMMLIKRHAQAGYDILKDIEFPWPVARIIYEHHERLDGSGYPGGLNGADLLLESRILMVADVVEAISSHRPYRPALGTAAALAEIEKNKGVRYDPEVVDVCVRLFKEKNYQWVADY